MRAQHVLPLAEEAGHVIGLVAQVLVVGRPAGGHFVLANPLAVERQVVQPVGRGADIRLRYLALHLRFAPQVGALGVGRVSRGLGGDEPALPLAPGEPRHEAGCVAPGAFLIVVVPDAHPREVPRRRFQGQLRHLHMGGFLRHDPAAVPQGRGKGGLPGDLQLVRRLHRARLIVLRQPAEPGRFLHAHGLGQVVHQDGLDIKHGCPPYHLSDATTAAP